MELIPAIDLLGGRVVRLEQGDYHRVTVYRDDPVAVARRWATEGAARLHVVDLVGARAGAPMQLDIVARVVDSVAIPCQLAGGLRTAADAARALELGADRVILGSALVDQPSLARQLVSRHGAARIVAAVDVRDGAATGDGWVPGAAARPADAHIRTLAAMGVGLFAVTAIERDGMRTGPDLALLAAAAEAAGGADRVIASAGIASVGDVASLAQAGYAGAILGRALYDGTLSLKAAMAAATAPAG
jgi:phosphoribosylformimino-5-aminoimidazole carboxamide ribotide isomerase